LVNPERQAKYAEYKWNLVLKDSEDGFHPTDAEVADMVKSLGVPHLARQYVADRILGKHRPGPGGKKTKEAQHKRWLRAADFAWEVHHLRAAFRIQQIPKPRMQAIKVVAKRKGLSVARLSDILKRDLCDAPYKAIGKYTSYYEDHVRNDVEDGIVVLDRIHGAVYPEDLDPDVRRCKEERRKSKERSEKSKKQQPAI
jgi:hypothetical protein